METVEIVLSAKLNSKTAFFDIGKECFFIKGTQIFQQQEIKNKIIFSCKNDELWEKLKARMNLNIKILRFKCEVSSEEKFIVFKILDFYS